MTLSWNFVSSVCDEQLIVNTESAGEVYGIILGTEIIGIHRVAGEGVWLRLQQVSNLPAERSVCHCVTMRHPSSRD